MHAHSRLLTPWLVIFSIDYSPTSHYAEMPFPLWEAHTPELFSFTGQPKASVLLVKHYVHYQWLLPAVSTLCVHVLLYAWPCACWPICCSQIITLTSILLSSKLDFYSSVSMLTYLLPFHHLRQGYPEASSTFMGTGGCRGGVEGLALPPAMP